jgi:carbon storage regulator
MLVLMRRIREEIVIPSLGVTIKVVDTRGGRVRIGIEAPDGVSIRRSELEPFSVDPDTTAAGLSEFAEDVIAGFGPVPAIKAG